MLSSILIGLVGGQRAMTPLAAVATAAWRERLPEDNGAPPLLGHPVVAAGAMALAAAEIAGDKQKTAPDRIVPIGLAARFVTSAIAGAALAPRRQRVAAGLVAGGVAVASSFVGWTARVTAMERYGQTATGFVEDAAVIAAAGAIVNRAGNATTA